LKKVGLPAVALAKAGVPQWTILELLYQKKAAACPAVAKGYGGQENQTTAFLLSSIGALKTNLFLFFLLL